MPNRAKILRCPALRIEQDPNHPLYLFTLTGAQLLQVADISRAGRSSDGRLIGYQRPEVRQHVRNIVEYLDSGPVLFPNSVILAFSTLTFRPTGRTKTASNHAVAGIVEVPIPGHGKEKPAWIVDGQQRTIAVSKSRIKELPVPVNAFVAPETDVQIDQFLRINSAKPLPRGLITELLPSVSTVLPSRLAARKAPSALCELLNEDSESPFRGLIRRATTPPNLRKMAVVADTAVVQMVQDSIHSVLGCLFPYHQLVRNEIDMPGARSVLLTYWNAVRDTFPDAWGLPPTKSRLMHGTGIRSMGRLMDRVMGAVDLRDRKAPRIVRQELAKIRAFCHWTSGEWEEMNGLRWNEVQNVPSHVRLLSNFLVHAYLGQRQALA